MSDSNTEDLWSLIEAGAFRKDKLPLTNRQRNLLAKSKRSEELARTLRVQQEKEKAEVRSMLHWQPVARVIIQFNVTCACGARHYYPEVFLTPPLPLLRYKNRQTGAIWEKRAEAGEIIPSPLPTELRRLPLHSDHCALCLTSILEGEQP